MKGVIYARYSSDNQREESIEGQLRECKEYAERNDITILGTYIDRALSAKTDNRPEFQHMIKESAKGLFDVVLVWKLDRFARNRYDSARYKNLLKKNGVKVISARENISEGSEGIILEAMLEGYAEYYSAELSEKVIRGLTDNALKCKYNGGTVPMGYYIDEQQYYQIDPKTAPVVLEMFTKYSEGATMQELVNLLNSRGMRSIRGGKITLNIMNHLLKNRRYMGEYSYRDVVKENGIPAIVPKELFERVQERLAKNKKAPARHKAEDDYLLTTKLYCGKCGSFMVGESGTSHTMKVHRYYRCVNTKKKKLCDKKAVKKDWIEDLVVNYTMKAIMNDAVMERLIDMLMELQKKESTDLPLLKKQLAETEKGINNMLNAIQAGIFTPSTKQRLDELEETKSQLEVSILQEEMHKPLLTREQIAFFIYRFRKFDVTKREQRQRLIDSFVNAVYLYEDKIILTFNYKDGSKTITLAEVEGSDLSVLGAPIKVLTEVRAFFVFNGKCKPKTKYRLTMARKYGLIASDKNCSGRGQHESTRNENRAEIGIYRQGNLLCRTFCSGNCNHGADIHSDAGRRSDDDADVRGHARGDCTGCEALDGFDRHLSHPRRGRRSGACRLHRRTCKVCRTDRRLSDLVSADGVCHRLGRGAPQSVPGCVRGRARRRHGAELCGRRCDVLRADAEHACSRYHGLCAAVHPDRHYQGDSRFGRWICSKKTPQLNTRAALPAIDAGRAVFCLPVCFKVDCTRIFPPARRKERTDSDCGSKVGDRVGF